MISVRTLSKDDWAKYALLVIYAWDMCDLNQDPASNELDPPHLGRRLDCGRHYQWEGQCPRDSPQCPARNNTSAERRVEAIHDSSRA